MDVLFMDLLWTFQQHPNKRQNLSSHTNIIDISLLKTEHLTLYLSDLQNKIYLYQYSVTPSK